MNAVSPPASCVRGRYALSRSHAAVPLVAVGLPFRASRKGCVQQATAGAARQAESGEGLEGVNGGGRERAV